jgi:hypothetical protein
MEPVRCRGLLVLVLAVLAACWAEPPAAPASLAAVGPIRVGMPAADANRTLKLLSLDVECRDKDGITDCRTHHAGTMGLRYELAGGRVMSATRLIASTTLPASVSEIAAAWESRYGPQDADAPAVQEFSVIRHWYREKEGVYRVNLCGRPGGMLACVETAIGVSPSAIAARVSSEAWDRRDVMVICSTWNDVVDAKCKRFEYGSLRPLYHGEVMRIRVVRGRLEAHPGGTLLFESEGAIRHRMWRVPDGSLYGVSCRDFEDTELCWEVIARYEPRPLLTAVIED